MTNVIAIAGLGATESQAVRVFGPPGASTVRYAMPTGAAMPTEELPEENRAPYAYVAAASLGGLLLLSYVMWRATEGGTR